MITDHDPSKLIRSDITLFDIIETLKELDGATLSELTEELCIAKSTAHSHLSTLRHRGYVTKEGNEYYLGLLFLDLGTHASQNRHVYQYARKGVDRLAELTNERTQFMIEEHGRGYMVYRGEGKYAVTTGQRLGNPRYLHDCAAGKAILAALPESRVDTIVSHWGLPPTTENTISARSELRAELETIRKSGYAVNRGESRSGLWAVGSSISNGTRVLGALSVSGPRRRIEDYMEGTVEDLLGITNEIELNLSSEDLTRLRPASR